MKKNIRWVVKDDIKEIAEIENNCFSHPWNEKDFIECLSDKNRICKVIEEENKVIGFMVYELKNKKFEILNIGIKPELQKKGYGKVLVSQLTDKLENGYRTEIDVLICDKYLEGHLFFKKLGFKALWVEKDFFSENNEKNDAYFFNYTTKKEIVQKEKCILEQNEKG